MTRNKFLLLLSMIACFGMIVSAGFAATKPVAAKWGFVRKVTIDNQNAQLTDAVIKVQLDNGFDYAKAAIGGADIRFAAKAGSFSGAGLSYWIEQWNDNGTSTIWVKVPKLAKGQNAIYLYYGNTEAKAVADGNATFLFFDDFESGDFTKKWNNVSIGQVEEKEGILKLKESDGQVGMITTGFDLSGKLIVRTLYQRQGGDQHWTAAGIGGWNNWFCFGDHTEVAGMGTNWLMFYNWASINVLDAAPLLKSTNKVITDKWRHAAYWYDGANIKGQQDDTIITMTAPDVASKLSLRTLDNDQWDNFAFITVSKFIDVEPVVSLGEEKKN